MICPTCKKNPGVQMLTHVAECEECYAAKRISESAENAEPVWHVYERLNPKIVPYLGYMSDGPITSESFDEFNRLIEEVQAKLGREIDGDTKEAWAREYLGGEVERITVVTSVDVEAGTVTFTTNARYVLPESLPLDTEHPGVEPRCEPMKIATLRHGDLAPAWAKFYAWSHDNTEIESWYVYEAAPGELDGYRVRPLTCDQYLVVWSEDPRIPGLSSRIWLS